MLGPDIGCRFRNANRSEKAFYFGFEGQGTVLPLWHGMEMQRGQILYDLFNIVHLTL